MSIFPPKHENKALVGLAIVLAAQIPVTIQSIADPVIRVGLQVATLLTVILLSWRARPDS